MATAVTSRVEAKVAESVGRVRLINPSLNVIDLRMARELQQALAELEARSDISVILFEGDAYAFSAGVDIKAHLPEQIHDMLTSFHAVIRAIVASRKVTIAAVRGTCLGGGAELAAVCDMVYTARDATWGFPEIKLGCYPPVAAVVLATLTGQKRASELILTGRQFSGDEAAEMGLANLSVAAEELESVVERTLGDLRQLSPAALASAKKAIYAWDAIHFDKGLARAEKIYLDELISTADAREGIIAFLEKRNPKWTGK
ncbi:MAG TPA: enoyl-CoA hydratase/isomerase family protein [Terriglobales bacterium]|jgi:cyclohexa-1,5-dienecarbonyl-CoA hydratase|nr:enoyl-CoA hydratase/isomerase family protein [Terriglobales bacterium]